MSGKSMEVGGAGTCGACGGTCTHQCRWDRCDKCCDDVSHGLESQPGCNQMSYDCDSVLVLSATGLRELGVYPKDDLICGSYLDLLSQVSDREFMKCVFEEVRVKSQSRVTCLECVPFDATTLSGGACSTHYHGYEYCYDIGCLTCVLGRSVEAVDFEAGDYYGESYWRLPKGIIR